MRGADEGHVRMIAGCSRRWYVHLGIAPDFHPPDMACRNGAASSSRSVSSATGPTDGSRPLMCHQTSLNSTSVLRSRANCSCGRTDGQKSSAIRLQEVRRRILLPYSRSANASPLAVQALLARTRLYYHYAQLLNYANAMQAISEEQNWHESIYATKVRFTRTRGLLA